MRVSSLLTSSLAFVALVAQAAPLITIEGTGLISYIEDHVQDILESSGCLAHDTEEKEDDYSFQDLDDFNVDLFETFVGEEYWFRFEDPAVEDAGDNILQLAQRGGDKNYDDQAYKWISSDAAKVTRSSMKDRLPTLYVLPRGTRESIDKLKQRFEDTSEAKRAAAYVTKDHEPGDIGINGVSKLAGDRIPLDVFRSQVIRTVVKKTSSKAGGKASYVTIKKGKKSKTAEEDDQKALARFK